MRKFRVVIALVVGLGVGAGVTYWLVAAKPAPMAGSKQEDVPNRGLDATLYMQISAEYRAACYQTYNLALARLREILLTRKNDGRQMAIILDLDETVFDNGAHQARQVKAGAGFDLKTWGEFETNGAEQVRLVPGALDFLVSADRLGIALIYISNRSEKSLAGTLKAIERLKVPLKGPDRVKLMGATSNKDPRRKETFDAFDVVMLIGDNLRDFTEVFRSKVDNTKDETKSDDPAKIAAAIAARFQAVDESREKFGVTWFLLPNPAYGEWNKVLGNGAKDADLLK